jgi:general secretion pathway protein H
MPGPVIDRRKLWRHRRRGHAGFSLIEVLIALALVAAMTTMAVVTLAPGRELAQLRMEAAEVASLLATARGQAITGRRFVHVVIDPRSNSVSIAAAQRHTLSAPAALVAAGDGERHAILFRPDGESSGGTVAIRSGDRLAVITVDWLSGRTDTEIRFAPAAS